MIESAPFKLYSIIKSFHFLLQKRKKTLGGLMYEAQAALNKQRGATDRGEKSRFKCFRWKLCRVETDVLHLWPIKSDIWSPVIWFSRGRRLQFASLCHVVHHVVQMQTHFSNKKMWHFQCKPSMRSVYFEMTRLKERSIYSPHSSLQHNPNHRFSVEFNFITLIIHQVDSL